MRRTRALLCCMGFAMLLAAGCGSSETEPTVAPTRAMLEERAAAARSEIAKLHSDTDPIRRADLHEELGNALSDLGDMEADTGSLKAGADALRTALAARSRERDPRSWAKTQSRLGMTLASLGARELDPATLEEAVALLRVAAQEPELAGSRGAWARTLSALGRALALLGGEQDDEALLVEAARDFESALEVFTQSGDRVESARTLDDLGLAYVRIAQASGRASTLPDAVRALRQALEMRAEARAEKPLEWAQTQNDLGEALHVWGMFSSDYDRLREAAAAYRASLEERTLSSVPQQAIGTRINLGLALTTVALGGTGTESLLEAKAELEQAVRDAMSVGYTGPPAKAKQGLAAIEIELRRRSTPAPGDS